jgi:polar amino acid transport system substrate-binding protein
MLAESLKCNLARQLLILLVGGSICMRALIPVALLLLLSSCDLPRDPEETLERVRGATMRVGVTSNPPWTTYDGDQPGGIEVSLVRQFAATLEANVEWVNGSEAKLMERLHEGQLDLVIGGLDDATPWTTHGGLTQPYITLAEKRHVMAVRQGENRFLLELDKFLQGRRAEIHRLVGAEAPR